MFDDNTRPPYDHSRDSIRFAYQYFAKYRFATSGNEVVILNMPRSRLHDFTAIKYNNNVNKIDRSSTLIFKTMMNARNEYLDSQR